MDVEKNTLNKYIGNINKFPILSKEIEKDLFDQWKKNHDKKAFDKIISSNLRFVVKIAHEYKGYGFNLLDIIQEGNAGLLIATKKFDPTKDFKFISYAVWWIRANIQNYILKSWSLVKLGTTQEQRKLFYKLRGTQAEIAKLDQTHSVTENTEKVAKELKVNTDIVINMNQRMTFRDMSLNNATVVEDNDKQIKYIDILPDLSDNQEERLGTMEVNNELRNKIQFIMRRLNPREKFILTHRIMSDEPLTLKEVGIKFDISRERARQLEISAITKIKNSLLYE